jgi:hypothetical protein
LASTVLHFDAARSTQDPKLASEKARKTAAGNQSIGLPRNKNKLPATEKRALIGPSPATNTDAQSASMQFRDAEQCQTIFEAIAGYQGLIRACDDSNAYPQTQQASQNGS